MIRHQLSANIEPIMKLSIIIPVFNEVKTIQKVVRNVLAQNTGSWEKEIIVVDDGSIDGTGREIEELGQPKAGQPRAENKKLIFLRHNKNCGKGAAVRTALGYTTGEAVIIQDADLEYDPADIPALLRVLEEPGVNVIYGSRELQPKRRGYFHYVLGVKFLTFLVNILFGTKLSDIYTGYKLFRADVLKSLNLESTGFEIEMELTVKLLKKRVDIKEMPIHYQPRKFSQGKKIRFKDAIVGAMTLFKHVKKANKILRGERSSEP